MKAAAVLLIAAFGGAAFYWPAAERAHPAPGATIAEEPLQTAVSENAPPFFAVGLTRVTPLAEYHIHARVLSAKTYWFDRESNVSPEDLALGWGRMSDWAVYSQLGIEQTGRFYRYRWGAGGPPIPPGEIVTHSANNHIIPASDEVGSTLKRVHAGDVVRIDGELVEVRDQAGGVWRSSLTRSDSGNGACELIYAQSLAIDPP